VFEYDSESISVSSGIRTESETTKTKSTIEDDLREDEVEPLIDSFASFAEENLILFFSPYFVLCLWIFYD
jgi:hypothetical protein